MKTCITRDDPDAFITQKQPVNQYIICHNDLTNLIKKIAKGYGASDEKIKETIKELSKDIAALARDAQDLNWR